METNIDQPDVELISEVCITLHGPEGTDEAVEIHVVSFAGDNYGLYAKYSGQPEGAMIAQFLPEVPFDVVMSSVMTLNYGTLTGLSKRAATVGVVAGTEQEG